MNDSLIGEIIVGLLTIISSYSLVNWRLKKLEEKVDKHNSYSDKIASITTDISVVRKDIEWIKSAVNK